MKKSYARSPASYPRRILMAVTGKTPQIVTETLWALAVGNEPRFVPTEIRLLTTEEGKRHLVEKLLNPNTGAFHALCQEWELEGIVFDESSIQVLRDVAGDPMEDIVTPEDNERAADAITTWIKEAATDEDAALHVSLAGGRKTMGYYVGYALSLFGRAQDRLSHVLVDERYERVPEFYYPTRETKYRFSRDGKESVDMSQGRVHLAGIPFVRLGLGMPKAVLSGKSSFTATVEAAEASLAPPSLELDFPNRTAICGGHPVKMEPALFAFYAWMALRRQELDDDAGVTWSNEGFMEDYVGYLETYARMQRWEIDMKSSADPYRIACFTLAGGFDEDTWNQRLNGIKACLEEALDYSAKHYLVGNLGKLGSGRNSRKLRGLKQIPPECITWHDREPPSGFKLSLPSTAGTGK